jgi:hypothetical protein
MWLYCFNGHLYYFFLSLAAEQEDPIIITAVRIIVISSLSQYLDSQGLFWQLSVMCPRTSWLGWYRVFFFPLSHDYRSLYAGSQHIPI